VFVTGGTGFIGRRVVARLRERGDEVVALVRSPGSAGDLGAEFVVGDLGDEEAIRRGLDGADACLHIAGEYRLGIAASERPAMTEANVGGTERVLDAAAAAGVARIVYVSTVNVFGNTRGQVVDETYRRDPADGFLSFYDETKYLAHLAAEERIAAGAPVVIVQPGGVYGPGDHSTVGSQIEQVQAGKLKSWRSAEWG
jgi:dihydroflavonol-4-reductase